MVATLEQPQATTESGEFVTMPDVPVFDEHQGDDVYYDRNLLEAIANNCNRRIERTGDYVPLVITHTSEDHDNDPEVIGFAGPFYVNNWRGKPAIMAKCRVFNDPHDLRLWKKHPRRSVEIWEESDPKDRYFDPIALLGAETPRRDLGLAYSRLSNTGVRRVRYTASFPGATSVTIPTTTTKQRNAKGTDMAISPDDMPQIIEALRPVIQQAIDEAMVGNATDPDAGEMDDIPLDGPADAPVEGMADAGPPEDADMDYGGAMAGKFMRYMKDDGFDEEGAGRFMDTLDDDDRKHVDAYMKHGCDNEAAKEHYSKYMKSDGDCGDDDDEEVQRYRRQRNDTLKKYRKLEADHTELKSRYSKLESTHQSAVRRSELLELESDGYVFDDIESEVSKFSGKPNKEWRSHVDDTIVKHYQRLPDGLPRGYKIDDSGPATSDRKSAKYAKQAAKISSDCKVDYKKTLEFLTDNDGREPTKEEFTKLTG